MSLDVLKNKVLPLKNKLFRFALRIVENRLEAEDVVQEVFIKMWKQGNELDKVKNVEAWCMKITKNLAIDKLRSKHRKTQEIEEKQGLSTNLLTPYQAAATKDVFHQIKKLIQQLPEKQKLVMQLRDIEGMSYQEISDILSIPLSQVKVNLFRARKQIRIKFIKSESYGL